jgi:hypothetical protein
VWVAVVDQRGAIVKSARVTDATGSYQIGVPAGTYRVRTTMGNEAGLTDQIYGGGDCLGMCDVTLGADVAVSSGATVAGVDFILPPRPVMPFVRMSDQRFEPSSVQQYPAPKYPGYPVQTLTVGQSGLMRSVEVLLRRTAAEPQNPFGSLRIHGWTSDGRLGPLLGSGALVSSRLPAVGATAWVAVQLAGPIPVLAGQKLALDLPYGSYRPYPSAMGRPALSVQWIGGLQGGYAGGEAGAFTAVEPELDGKTNDGSDLGFRTYVDVDVAGPIITSVDPHAGPATGGTGVTITGGNFAPAGVSVTFGGGNATDVVTLSSTTLTAKTPPGTPGASVVVTVTNPDGQSGSVSGKFTYDACQPPVITQQPVSQRIDDSGRATFSVTATGTQLTYEWQQMRPDEAFDVVPLRVLPTLTHDKATGARYRVNVVNQCGQVLSNVVNAYWGE